MEAQAQENQGGKKVLFQVDIHHLCWFCDLTERNRDATIVSTMASANGDLVTNILKLISPTPEKDIGFIRRHPLVKDVSIIMQNPNSALLKVVSKYDAMTYKELNQTDVALLESPLTTDGTDSEILLAGSHKAMEELLSRWKERDDYYEVKLVKKRYVDNADAASLNAFSTSGFFDLKAARELLSEKQMSVFRTACEYGYYDSPKRISIDELAEKSGLSPSTLAEHLRKAETKLLPVLAKVLGRI